MSHRFDLDAYLQRIGHTGPVRADLSTLRAIIAAHTASIPFENLDPFLHLPVSLDLAWIERKLVRSGRGGYCFEQNSLLRAALTTIGFQVEGLIARVLWGRDPASLTPQTHMLLRIELDGESWLADVGFGGQTLSGVLHLRADIEQPTPHEPFRLTQADGNWWSQSLVRGEWLTLYRFDLQPRFSADYEVANHYTSTYPASHFRHTLRVARLAPMQRMNLSGRQFTLHTLGGESVKRTLGSAEEICEVLREVFGIRLPEHPHLLQRLDALPMDT
ncbi:arylamine N-acetyltransferase family protein [Dyella flagellata]|uniref:N-hydroxyarylamine O-acetyltransferase n=1 Tax=Dyella flagellata TaxID=1867833 RepID=A0ABQ5XD38_9GAMM|nr:arylamine N-acetyltransferase [Dyella flagellata]GLQ89392.1 N-hydroxyarylamine O-acetyltransferase [Dyella flagellata]